MWILLIVLVLMLFIAILNRHMLNREYKISNPLNLLLIAWGIVLILHGYYYGITERSNGLYLLIFAGIASFSIGFWLNKNVRLVVSRTNNIRSNKEYSEAGLYSVIRVLTVFELIRAMYCSWIMYRLAGSLSTFIHDGTYVRNLYLTRSSSIVESLFTMFLALSCMIGLVLVAIYSAKKMYRYKRYMVIWLVLEFAMTVITMSKMSFILSLSVYLVAYINNAGTIKFQKKVIRRILPIAIGAIVTLLFIIGVQRNYKQFGGSLSENIINGALFYVTSPVEALGNYMSNNKSDIGLGIHTFKFFSRILTRLGVINSDVSILGHGAMIDTIRGRTNVYSWYKTFYDDFSYVGFFIGPLIMGFISGLVYKVKTNGLVTDVTNAWMCGIVVMSFYAYLFVQSTYVLIFFYAILFETIVQKKLYKSADLCREYKEY